MSRFTVSLLALGSFALAACAPAPDEQQQARDQAEQRAELAATPAPPPPPAVDAAACDAAQAQWLVGKTPTDADIEQARTDAGAQSARTLEPGQVVTMEYNATRLNIDLDEAGAVVSVRCG